MRHSFHCDYTLCLVAVFQTDGQYPDGWRQSQNHSLQSWNSKHHKQLCFVAGGSNKYATCHRQYLICWHCEGLVGIMSLWTFHILAAQTWLFLFISVKGNETNPNYYFTQLNLVLWRTDSGFSSRMHHHKMEEYKQECLDADLTLVKAREEWISLLNLSCFTIPSMQRQILHLIILCIVFNTVLKYLIGFWNKSSNKKWIVRLKWSAHLCIF
jgi:hypothetical protein